MAELLVASQSLPARKLAVSAKFGYNTAISFSGNLFDIYKIQ